ncbi:hypothetical protein SLA2020_351560 [Shorea laevis]
MPPSSGGIILSPPGRRPDLDAAVVACPSHDGTSSRVSARLASSPPSNPGMFSFFNSDDSNSVSEELSDSDL